MSQDLFYVIDNECMSCGVPVAAAPDLVEWHTTADGLTHCRFKRQPENPGELRRAIQAINGSCCGAVMYGGSDPEVLARIPGYALGTAPRPPEDWRDAITIPNTLAPRPDFGELTLAHRILATAGVLTLVLLLWSALTVKSVSQTGLLTWVMLLSASIGLLRGLMRSSE